MAENKRLTFKQNLMNDFKIIGRSIKSFKQEVIRRPFTCGVAYPLTAVLAYAIAEGFVVPIVLGLDEKNVNNSTAITRMEEKIARMEQKMKNVKDGNPKKTDA